MTTRVVIYGVLVLSAIVYVMPLVVMVMTSLKPLSGRRRSTTRKALIAAQSQSPPSKREWRSSSRRGRMRLSSHAPLAKSSPRECELIPRFGIGENHTFAFNLDKAVLFDPQTSRRI